MALVAFAAITAVAVPRSVSAQDSIPSRPLRIGLALSGGSAKGLAHIGVLQALEELGVPVHMVAGTSMGGLVGGLYATGFTTTELEAVALQLDWTALFTDRVERRLLNPERRLADAGATLSFPLTNGRITLPTGAVRGQNVMRLLQRLTWDAQQERDFTKLPRPFAAVATDLENGAAVVLKSGRLDEALRASMSLPAVFDPIRVQGRLLIDGGYARNLPAQDARELGADFLICSDVSSAPGSAASMRTLLDVVMQTINLQMHADTEPQRRLCDILIRPETSGLSASDFRAAISWVERGRAAALARRNALDSLVRRAAPPPALEGTGLQRRIRVERIDVRGTTNPVARRVVLRTVAIATPAIVSAGALDEAIARLYATGLFLRASYDLQLGADTTLTFDVTEGASDQLGVGLRFDDHRKAALLFTASLHNLVHYGSTLRLDLRVGEQTQATAFYMHGLGILSPFSRGVEASYSRAVFDVWQNGRNVAEARSTVIGGGAISGVSLSRTTLAGVRLGVERAHADASIAVVDSSHTTVHASAAAFLLRNTLDRRAFASRGIVVRLESSWQVPLNDTERYARYIADVTQLLPLSRTTSLRARAVLGALTGADPPVHTRFFLGGAYSSALFAESQPPFWGLAPQERHGTAVQLYRVALQRELPASWYVTAGFNAGGVYDRWRLVPDSYLTGGAVAVSAATPLGPLELTLHTRSLSRRPRLDVNFGYSF